MKTILLAAFVLIQTVAFAQKGTLKGVAIDSTTSEALIGAVISMEGNASIGNVTDVDGSFEIQNIPAGTHSFKISYLGYKDLILKDIVIKAGETTSLNNVYMHAESDETMEVTVVGQRQTNTEAAVIQEIKESEQVVSGISSEQISKSQDRDAAQVISRVPGVTVIDNAFVMVRGLNQRYNGIMLNGLNAPSTETDNRAFALDIIPSAMLDRMLVFKSGAAELPADMTGSQIKIYTKNTVTENFANVNATIGIRPGTTFTTRSSQTTYGMDALGFGNSSRALPSSFPSNLNSDNMIYNGTGQENAAKSLNNDWNLKDKNVNPDIRLGFNIGRVANLGSKKISSILAMTYSNTWQYMEIQRSRNSYTYDLTKKEYEPTKLFDYKLNQLQNNVRLGLIWNNAFIINGRNKIEFKNMFNQNGITKTTVRDGFDYADNTEIIDRALYYQQRSIYSGQLSGSHELANDKTEFDWSLGYSAIKRNEPDFRRGGYQRAMGSNDAFKVVVPSQATDINASKFNSNLQESSIGAALDVTHKLTEDKEKRKGITLRAGFFSEFRNRSFESRWMSYVIANPTNFNQALLDQPLESIFKDENINRSTGFILNEGTDGSNAYTASSELLAGYAGATIPVNRFILSLGARLESSVQRLDSKKQSGVPVKVDNPLLFVLPSLNVSYNITEKSLIRAAFAQTVNRPEFRELAPFGFYDFENDWKLTGNPGLMTTTANNYDLRYEVYPSDNESFSFGGFYKDMTNPIEMYIEPVGTLTPAYYYGNAPKATCYGLEVEVRKSLKFISAKPLFEKLSLLVNASVIKSEVKLDESKLSPGQSSTRQLQGQSPYVINAGLYYNDEVKKLQMNVMYNLVGPRIFGVGDKMFATIYQVQRHVVDFTVTKGFGKHWEMKAGVRDLLNQAFIMKEDSDRDFKSSAADQTVTSYKMGAYFTLGASYTF
jgi:TonB-dependent receptor